MEHKKILGLPQDKIHKIQVARVQIKEKSVSFEPSFLRNVANVFIGHGYNMGTIKALTFKVRFLLCCQQFVQ